MNLSALNKATAGKTRTTGISPFSELELSKVYANPKQPRKSFENIEELATSIKINGLLQPISVVKKQDGYMIIGGERRYRASLHAGLKTIRAHILQADEKQVLELSLVENIQREDLTDFEKAQFISLLWESGNYAQKQDLAAAISKSQSYVSKALGTCKLDESIIADIQEQKRDIGLSVLEEISRVPDKTMQKEVYDLIVKKEITRDEIKNFKELKGWDESKVTEVPQMKVSRGKKTIIYQDTFSKTQIFEYFLKSISNALENKASDSNYKITIEEIEICTST
ncbi:MAG: ParB/RepB/Spo0J family partition protein [Sulfurimonas sp.]|uniref:ParB/RepB/Spo0J family partition protein n=1 Tax=Sulfurimonas sp. TaxID=2022749 RepID=UPI0028CEC538|nr:ParB/RepB/Spo0J family partition protein [Sulfurimonas sp.]MDT8338559.1 ParB/RepB/Spo0J family partition protein [Sulfurimonas sp.]